MASEGKTLQGLETSAENDKRALSQCEQRVQYATTKDKTVKYMLKHLARAGCPMSRDKIHCERCSDKIGGGYRLNGTITICSNNVMSKAHMRETLVHEMIHAFDDCRANVHWDDCNHLACTETRAAALSGDCRWFNEFRRGNQSIAGQFQRCVRRRAEISLTTGGACTETEALRALDNVFDACYNDPEPFYRIP